MVEPGEVPEVEVAKWANRRKAIGVRLKAARESSEPQRDERRRISGAVK